MDASLNAPGSALPLSFLQDISFYFGRALRHVESSSPTRDQARTPCSGSPVLTTGPPGESPTHCLLLGHHGRSGCRGNLRPWREGSDRGWVLLQPPREWRRFPCEAQAPCGPRVLTSELGSGTPEPPGRRSRQGASFLKCSPREQRTASPTSGS